VTLPSGSNAATLCPFDDRSLTVANLTQPESESLEDKKSFEEASKELDCNPISRHFREKNSRNVTNKTDWLSLKDLDAWVNQPRHDEHRDRQRQNQMASALLCIP
jgi:hypothetical protein